MEPDSYPESYESESQGGAEQVKIHVESRICEISEQTEYGIQGDDE